MRTTTHTVKAGASRRRKNAGALEHKHDSTVRPPIVAPADTDLAEWSRAARVLTAAGITDQVTV